MSYATLDELCNSTADVRLSDMEIGLKEFILEIIAESSTKHKIYYTTYNRKMQTYDVYIISHAISHWCTWNPERAMARRREEKINNLFKDETRQ